LTKYSKASALNSATVSTMSSRICYQLGFKGVLMLVCSPFPNTQIIKKARGMFPAKRD
jgi:hypothetical protein